VTSDALSADPWVFEHRTRPQQVLFGSGQAAEHLRAELGRRGAARPMVIVTGSADAAARRLLDGVEVALWFDDVVQHVPVETAERARALARDRGVDLVVSVGGGSATGLAKAVALTTGLPVVAVPTTYAGSEVTDVWGMTEGGRKTTGTDDRVLPQTVVYDAELTVSMPVGLSVVSGLNALAHCVDSLWGPRANPASTGLATEGVRLLGQGLPLVAAHPEELPGRERALAGAYLAAAAFAGAGSGMHHKICHVLGGRFDLPHAPTHAVVLPHVLAFNAPAAPEAARRVAEALGADDAVSGLGDLYERLDPPGSLRELGMPQAGLPEAVELVLEQVPQSNPRVVDRDVLGVLLRAAWAGETPAEGAQPS
jgi:maleylacetate reductase